MDCHHKAFNKDAGINPRLQNLARRVISLVHSYNEQVINVAGNKGVREERAQGFAVRNVIDFRGLPIARGGAN